MNLAHLPYALAPMQLDDLPTIASIEKQVFATPWSMQAYRQEILYHDTAAYLVLRHLGQPGKSSPLRRPWGTGNDPSLIGYGGVWMVLEEAHVCTLAVRPEWRRRGLGEVLFAALVERALEQNAGMVTLEVRASNHAAQSLYAKYGLEKTGLRRGYYPDNQEDAVIMSTPSIQTAAYRATYSACVDALLRKLEATQPLPASERRHPTDEARSR